MWEMELGGREGVTGSDSLKRSLGSAYFLFLLKDCLLATLI